MIRPATGRDVEVLIERVRCNPASYTELAICSPFIDDEMLLRVLQIAKTAERVGCRVQLFTSPSAAARARRIGLHAVAGTLVLALDVLHAKAYLALSRDNRRSTAIVSSANLTIAGLRANIEFGISATVNSTAGESLICEVRRFLRGLHVARVGSRPRVALRRQ
jgi:hypothetical protein